MRHTKCAIRKNIDGEYEVPDKFINALENDNIYYTDDREDAIGTAKAMHGADVEITIRTGTYS